MYKLRPAIMGTVLLPLMVYLFITLYGLKSFQKPTQQAVDVPIYTKSEGHKLLEDVQSKQQQMLEAIRTLTAELRATTQSRDILKSQLAEAKARSADILKQYEQLLETHSLVMKRQQMVIEAQACDEVSDLRAQLESARKYLYTLSTTAIQIQQEVEDSTAGLINSTTASNLAAQVREEVARVAAQTCASMDSVLEEVRRRYMMLTLDTVGKPDFALRSNGAKVVREKTFATYTIPGHLVSSAWMHSMGLENGVGLQDDAISASTAVGRCWAMQGSTGDLTVELARPVVVRSVTLDHTDFRVATHISTAPRDFQVWGYPLSGDMILLGEFTFLVAGGFPVQTFQIQKVLEEPVDRVTLRVLSNHGHEDYTCIYRFRVHNE